MTIQMPGDSRKHVRNAVRSHARCDEILAHYGVKYVNNLTQEQLIGACALLEINAVAIVAHVVSRETASPIVAPIVPVEVASEAIEQTESDTMPVDDIATEAAALRRELASAMVEGNFDLITGRLTSLLTDTRKPAEVVHVATDPTGAAPPYMAKPVSRSSWGALFGVTGDHAARECMIWDSPEAPAIDPAYRWPDATLSALCALGRHRHPWFFGPPGTGKTSWAEQLAARLGRPFRTISCDDTTEAPELVGMRGPHDGRTVWLDGILASAMRIPGCVILIDEPTVARAGAVMVLQSVLQNRYLFVKETGEKIVAARGVMFIAADNTNGTGEGAAAGYESTRRMNSAFLDRFAVKLRVGYMPRDVETSVLVDRTGCTTELAGLLVDTAIVTRTRASSGGLNTALGLRRLMAWAEQLTDGVPPRAAFECAVLNGAPEEDREVLEQLCLLAFDPSQIGPALTGRAPENLTPRERNARTQFAGN